ncbi:hypothetical protein GOBAR_AA11619 [Gossypium barbadense]|uniref:Uncharacterized protein n=1 Tax=Gossypium barbadense TaxID=3634 RepID=A0A2P5Y0D7_GOSBA|nr:hypothetical protein GOBAR_AA11619 [Gossypium barbadense]
MASGFEILGTHRHKEHRVDYMDWAPGARYCALVGDFNGWSPTTNAAREGLYGHDDYGYWFIILEDKLREGEEPDELYFQQYNYVDDYDKGDSGVTIDEVFQRANDEYWEPGEDRFIKNRFELPAKLYERLFGPNGPQTIEELGEIPDAETRYKAHKELHKDDPPSNLPPFDVIDNGKEYDIFNVVVDPAWQEKFRNKKPPLAYWTETRKGRKAWLKKYTPAIPHGSKYRVYFNTPDGPLERVPAWANFIQPDAEGKQAYAIHWEPPPEYTYKWKHTAIKPPKSLRIYECHVGISGSEPKISSFNDFTEKVLPHVKRAGYNAIQLIGIVEHKDYFTVGYRVTNFFAVSSRYGTPEDFKRLVDEAHGHYFLQFSRFYINLKVLVVCKYCNQYVDNDAVKYLILANEILHALHPNIITIAEDATFYPGLCEPTSQGGLGFDYHVNLSASEMWLSLLKNTPDHEWSMSKITSTLLGNKNYADKMLVYAENHNQSISGGQSLAEILLSQGNDKAPQSNELLLRGSSLLKMIKLITFTIGGRGYLNFMGNEFGHPKRVEFPMPSNNFSFSLANRCWDLLEKEGVYQDLFRFDKDMMKLDKNEKVLSRGLPNIHHVKDTNMVISYLRGPLLFVFNFHPTDSYERYCIGVDEAGEYQVILNTDERRYGGQGIVKEEQYLQRTISKRVDGLRNCIKVSLPSRTAQGQEWFVDMIMHAL